jgi:galactarate dehydratase
MTITQPLITLSGADNVATTRRPVAQNEPLLGGLAARSDIPRGHKLALKAISLGEPIVKYGQIIGYASQDIGIGDHVHTHNVEMREIELHHAFSSAFQKTDFVPEAERATFEGYVRADGRVGTRNFIAILSSVNCSATVSHAVADHFNRGGGLNGFDNIDGVVALTHGGGCAINTLAEGYLYLTRVIAGYATHPNVGGALMIGLGCETNQIPHILRDYKLEEGERLRTMTIQDVGGTKKTIATAIDAIGEMLERVNADRRTTVDASHLTVALECGGSDAYSGMSANPALGHAADLLVRHGGTAVLAETPEIYGGEHLLTSRAASPAVAEKLLDRIEWWRHYAESNNAELNNNPSHGNKVGGLTTILEKSLGAISKSGSTSLNAVYEYAEQIDANGLVFMDTPGYDPVAVTGQIAGGCNVVCFTTGRGSTSGYKPAPCLKIATNTVMYERMVDDMDINCGEIVSGNDTIEAAGMRIFRAVLATASGAPTLSEQQNYGNNEFVPWQVGAIM